MNTLQRPPSCVRGRFATAVVTTIGTVWKEQGEPRYANINTNIVIFQFLKHDTFLQLYFAFHQSTLFYFTQFSLIFKCTVFFKRPPSSARPSSWQQRLSLQQRRNCLKTARKTQHEKTIKNTIYVQILKHYNYINPFIYHSTKIPYVILPIYP